MKTKNIFLTVIATVLLNGCFSIRFPVADDTPRLSENDFDINIYQPFNNDGKVATLDTVSTLKLKKNCLYLMVRPHFIHCILRLYRRFIRIKIIKAATVKRCVIIQ